VIATLDRGSEPGVDAPEIREIDVARLGVRPEYQRPLNMTRVRRLARNWDEHKVGVLEVSFDEGRYWVLDGQHRLAALAVLGIERTIVRVHYGLDMRDEARLFREMNTERRTVGTVDIYRAELVEGIERALRIDEAVTERGLAITQATNGKLRGNELRAVESLYRLGNQVGEVLDIVMAAWDDHEGGVVPGGFQGRTLDIVGDFVRTYSDAPTWSREHLINVLMRRLPIELIRDARANVGDTRANGVRVLLDWYNRSLPPAERLSPRKAAPSGKVRLRTRVGGDDQIVTGGVTPAAE
jgi:hypothetical protein